MRYNRASAGQPPSISCLRTCISLHDIASVQGDQDKWKDSTKEVRQPCRQVPQDRGERKARWKGPAAEPHTCERARRVKLPTKGRRTAIHRKYAKSLCPEACHEDELNGMCDAGAI